MKSLFFTCAVTVVGAVATASPAVTTLSSKYDCQMSSGKTIDLTDATDTQMAGYANANGFHTEVIETDGSTLWISIVAKDGSSAQSQGLTVRSKGLSVSSTLNTSSETAVVVCDLIK